MQMRCRTGRWRRLDRSIQSRLVPLLRVDGPMSTAASLRATLPKLFLAPRWFGAGPTMIRRCAFDVDVGAGGTLWLSPGPVCAIDADDPGTFSRTAPRCVLLTIGRRDDGCGRPGGLRGGIRRTVGNGKPSVHTRRRVCVHGALGGRARVELFGAAVQRCSASDRSSFSYDRDCCSPSPGLLANERRRAHHGIR
jgi:hypothetical protein